MKSKKYIYYISFTTSLVSLLLALLFFEWAKNNSNYEFLWELFLGLFSGAILSVFITLIEYYDCRRKNLEELFDLFHRQRYSINQIKYYEDHRFDDLFYSVLHKKFVFRDSYKSQEDYKKLLNNYKNNTILYPEDMPDDEKTVMAEQQIRWDQSVVTRRITEVIDSYQGVEYFYSKMGNIIVDTSFIFKPRKRFKTLMGYYGMIQTLSDEFIKADFHFKNYQDGNCSPSVIVDYIKELQTHYFTENISVDENDDCQKTVYDINIKKIDSAMDYIGKLCYGRKYVKTNKNVMNDEFYICCEYHYNTNI